MSYSRVVCGRTLQMYLLFAESCALSAPSIPQTTERNPDLPYRRESNGAIYGAIFGGYLLLTGLALSMYGVIYLFWGDRFLMEYDDLFAPTAGFGEALGQVWPIFAFAFIVTLLLGLIDSDPLEGEPGEILGLGLWTSLNAGVFEEIIYRWLLFFTAMVTIPFVNWLTLGLLKWWYTDILVPLANWTTFGMLEEQLLNHPNWVFGAAIVSASVSFRNDHKNHPVIGKIVVWYVGMVMFYIVFHYGLVEAMMAHFVYDAIIFATIAMFAAARPRNTYRSRVTRL